MAITKLLRLKESPRGSPAAHLKHNLLYICNPDKCAGGTLIGGNAGITPETILQVGPIFSDIMANKRLWGKEDGTQGFHYVISFPPELNVSEETACAVAEDFVSELLGDRFYYAYAVHNDPDRDRAGSQHCTYSNQRGCIQGSQLSDDFCDAAASDLWTFHLDADSSGRVDWREHVLAA